MATELARPGVEVEQVFRTESPSVVTPALLPVIIGVCRQVVDLMVPSASGGSQLNPKAMVSLPAMLTTRQASGTPPVFTGIGDKELAISINNGNDVSIIFSDPTGLGLTPAEVAQQINDRLLERKATDLRARTTKFAEVCLYTIGTGDIYSIEIRPGTSPEVLTAFGGAPNGWAIGCVYQGAAWYQQQKQKISTFSFPDPRNNMDELAIEPKTVRVFSSAGGQQSKFREHYQDQSFLRRGGGISSATLEGTVDLTTLTYGAGGPLVDGKLSITFGTRPAMVVDVSTAADAQDVIQRINTAFTKMVASLSAENRLKLTLTDKEPTILVESAQGTPASALGFDAPNHTIRGSGSVSVIDDGDGSNFSALVRFEGEDFTASATPARYAPIAVDYANAGMLGNLTDKTLTISVNGSRPQTLTFETVPQASELKSVIEEFFADLTLDISTPTAPVWQASGAGDESTIEFLGGTALGVLGIVPVLESPWDLTQIRNPGVAGSQLAYLDGKNFWINLNGTEVHHTWASITDFQSVLTSLNNNPEFSALAVASQGTVPNSLQIRLLEGSHIHVIRADTDDTSVLLGFSPGQAVDLEPLYGKGFPPAAGDDLFVDGVLIASVRQVAPNGQVDVLKVNKQLTLTSKLGDYWYLWAKNLPESNRPSPDLAVDGAGNAFLKHNAVRDFKGQPLPQTKVKAPLYVAYQAIRKDVTASAKKPGLLYFDSLTQLEEALSPINEANPLALGISLALQNAPGIQIAALGVDEISTEAPYGTVEAYTRACEMLEAYEVYAMAPLTHDEGVAGVFNLHVSHMSSPENKGERIVLFNLKAPTRKMDTLVASGSDGNAIGADGVTFDTGITNLTSLLVSQGIDPGSTVPTDRGLFLKVASSANRYSIQEVSGSQITIRTAFSPGDNEDSFYSVSKLSLPLINENFSINVRGGELTTPAGGIDKYGVAETYQKIGQSFSNRRFWNVVPDACEVAIEGARQAVEGFYLTAAIAGMIGFQPPQQSFTNFPMVGFYGVRGSSNYFSDKQMNIIAAGGNYIVVQDAVGTPLISRHSLTTDMTSIETRTDSVVKALDFTAKILRIGVRNYIGRYNVNQGLLDTLAHVTQGILSYVVEDLHVLESGRVNNILQDENQPDRVLLEVYAGPPIPCNKIRFFLVI